MFLATTDPATPHVKRDRDFSDTVDRESTGVYGGGCFEPLGSHTAWHLRHSQQGQNFEVLFHYQLHACSVLLLEEPYATQPDWWRRREEFCLLQPYRTVARLIDRPHRPASGSSWRFAAQRRHWSDAAAAGLKLSIAQLPGLYRRDSYAIGESSCWRIQIDHRWLDYHSGTKCVTLHYFIVLEMILANYIA